MGKAHRFPPLVFLLFVLGGCSLPRAVGLSVLANSLPVPAGASHVERSIDPIPAEDTPAASVIYDVDWGAGKLRNWLRDALTRRGWHVKNQYESPDGPVILFQDMFEKGDQVITVNVEHGPPGSDPSKASAAWVEVRCNDPWELPLLWPRYFAYRIVAGRPIFAWLF